MPTDKTPFSFVINDEYLQKIRFIAAEETRSVSNLLVHLCRLKIEEYEKEHGEIVLDIEE